MPFERVAPSRNRQTFAGARRRRRWARRRISWPPRGMAVAGMARGIARLA